MQECDVFGRSCFSRAMKQFTSVGKGMCPHCARACEYTNYHKTMTGEAMGFSYEFFDIYGNVKYPCTPKDFCEYLMHSNGTIDSINDWMQELTGTKPDTNALRELSNFMFDHINMFFITFEKKIRSHIRYAKIVEAGFYLQLDCPDLAMGRHHAYSK